MWQGASEQKLAATRGYGATVDLEATGPAEAFERLWQLIDETGRTLVHPHDDPGVVAGAGTVGLEIEEDAPDADAVIVAVGGGGLIAGITAALGDRMRDRRRRARDEPRLPRRGRGRASRPRRAAVDRRRPQRADRSATLPFELCRDLERVLVTEEEIEDAFRFLYARAKLACEPQAPRRAAALLSRARWRPSARS